MSYRKIDQNKYRIEVEKQINGQRRRKSQVVETTLKGKDLQFFIANIEAKLIDIITSDTKYDFTTYTFAQFAEYFLENSTAKQKTIDTYAGYLKRRTLDHFGKMLIVDIKKYHIEQFISNLKKENLSPKTIKHYRDLIRAILNKALDLEIIPSNPVKGIKIPKETHTLHGKFYQSQEISEMISALTEHGMHKYLVFLVLQFYTGARPSEMYGLKWNKIDFANQTITINEALIRTTKGYQQLPTKTEDERTAALSPYLLSILEELYEEEQEKHNKKDISNKYVFTNSDGEHLSDLTYRNYFMRFCKKHGLRYVSPYGIRHTTGTILSSQKIPLVNISKVLGHTNQSTTQKYVHPVQTVDEKVKEILTDITTPKLKVVK